MASSVISRPETLIRLCRAGIPSPPSRRSQVDPAPIRNRGWVTGRRGKRVYPLVTSRTRCTGNDNDDWSKAEISDEAELFCVGTIQSTSCRRKGAGGRCRGERQEAYGTDDFVKRFHTS